MVSISSRSRVGWSRSIVRKVTASLGRVHSFARAHSSSRISSRRVLPDCFSGLRMLRYGVWAAASTACVCKIHSATQSSCSGVSTTKRSTNARTSSSSSAVAIAPSGSPACGRTSTRSALSTEISRRSSVASALLLQIAQSPTLLRTARTPPSARGPEATRAHARRPRACVSDPGKSGIRHGRLWGPSSSSRSTVPRVRRSWWPLANNAENGSKTRKPARWAPVFAGR